MLRKIAFFLLLLASVVWGDSEGNTTSSTEQLSPKVEHLKPLHWKGSGIELHFDLPIDPKKIHLSRILEPDKNRFRYILDIPNSLMASQSLVSDRQHKIRVSPYKQKMVRMVIEYHEALVIQPIIDGGNIYVDLSLPALGSSFTPIVSQPLVDPVPKEIPVPLSSVPQPLTTPTLIPVPLDSSSSPVVDEERVVEEKHPKIIVIDPGHGGKDTGATANGAIEKEIVLQIGLQLSQKLQSMGYTVYMTRYDDTFIELKERTQMANDKLADLFLSIHANSIPKTSDPLNARGVETYYLSPGRSERAKGVAAFENAAAISEMGEYGKMSFLNVLNSEKILASHKLAIDIQRGVAGNLQKQYSNVKSNGAREAPFWVLVGAQMPAILLETGYISHPEESARLVDPVYQRVIVEGMAEGVAHYFINNP